MNLDIDRVIELFFPHKCEFLYRLGLDGILVCFCRSSLNQSPSEPNDINKTWLIRVSGRNSSVLHIRVRNRNSVGRCVIPWEFFGKSVKHTFSCRKMYPV